MISNSELKGYLYSGAQAILKYRSLPHSPDLQDGDLLRWLDRYERRPGEEPPIGLILCGEKIREQIELLQLDRGEIRVAEYLVELPPKGLLEAKLHEAIRLARGQVKRSSEN